MQKLNWIFVFILGLSCLLICCTRPTAPELDNPYDQDSESYIQIPDFSTAPVTTITATSAISGGIFANDYGLPAIQKGVCWSTNEKPTIEDICTNNGEGNSSFVSVLQPLEPDTQYFVRAYATNADSTIYGGQLTFTTRDGLPSISTTPASNILAFSAQTGGTILFDGLEPVVNRGVCYATTENPTLEDSCISAGDGEGEFEVTLEELIPDMQYFIRAFLQSDERVGYGNQLSFTTRDGVPSLITTEPFDISRISAQTGGTITDDGGADISEAGVCYVQGDGIPNFNDICVTATVISEVFEVTLENLVDEETYTVRAYAATQLTVDWGDIYNFTTSDWPVDTETTVVEVTNPITGRIWMDRNLGSSRAATSSTDSVAYGDLYQWGRASDGHQKRNSQITSSLSNSNQPGHGDFIIAPGSLRDWRSTPNDNLWQGVNGINNPCPPGYRLPTDAEWNAERNSWSSNNASGAFGSPLKLPMAGFRSFSSGSLFDVGSFGYYWSSTVSGSVARRLGFGSSNAYMFSNYRANGFSVRCIKD